MAKVVKCDSCGEIESQEGAIDVQLGRGNWTKTNDGLFYNREKAELQACSDCYKTKIAKIGTFKFERIPVREKKKAVE